MKPECCGQPARLVVQSISLEYWFCDSCKQEPAASVKHPVLEEVDKGNLGPFGWTCAAEAWSQGARYDQDKDIWVKLTLGIPGWVSADGTPYPESINQAFKKLTKGIP